MTGAAGRRQAKVRVGDRVRYVSWPPGVYHEVTKVVTDDARPLGTIVALDLGLMWVLDFLEVAPEGARA